MSSLQRRRGRAVARSGPPSDAVAPVVVGSCRTRSDPCDVFGYRPVTAGVLEELRVREQTAVFERVARAAQTKYAEKKRAYQAVRHGTTVCHMSDAARAKFHKKIAKRRQAYSARCIFGDVKLTWQQLLRSLGGTGDPWLLLESSALGQGALDIALGGKPFREYLANDVISYVASMAAPLRRIILVQDVSCFPPHLQMAAILVRARVQ